MMDIEVDLLQWFITAGGAAMLPNKSAIQNKNISNKELAEELHIYQICSW